MSETRMPNALVVDDDITGRSFLRALLKRAGYAVEVAASGEAALEMFKPGAFDVVFMDLMMPGIDGIETTRRLKKIAGEVFTPVIFVTGASDEDSLVRAIEAGGDDFLGKPVTPGILLAKLSALERIRRVHARTHALYSRLIEDQESAREVFDRAVTQRAFTSPALRSRLIPAEVFSGDLLLAARSPEGRLHLLVGDFTGHGLAAALGAMPVAEAFRSMVMKGFAPELMLGELNRKVADALPRGHFLAVAMASVDARLEHLTTANCGMPPLLLCDGDGVRRRVVSSGFALGIDRDASYEDAFETLSIVPGERLVIASDGVSEAVNDKAEAFGEARLEQLLRGLDDEAGDAPIRVVAALGEFCRGTPFADDVTVVELCLTPTLFAPAAGDRGAAEPVRPAMEAS